MSTTKTRSTGGTPGGPGTNQAQPSGPGSFFRVPKISTRRRYVPDTKNTSVAYAPEAASQVNAPFDDLDQLDIVKAVRLTLTGAVETWAANTDTGVTVSPFFPASRFKAINFKLQAAYDSYNLTGPLAQIIQAFRPLRGWRHVSKNTRNQFAIPKGTIPTIAGAGAAFTTPDLTIDIPLSWHFDEYWDLDIKGNPIRKVYDALVSPQFMAAQARIVTPTVTIAPALSTNDLLGAPVSRESGGNGTATYANGTVGKIRCSRDAFWTAKNPAGNPPQFPWQYTRDYFTQATSGQNEASVLIQNTGVSVGQVMSLFGFIWDPDLNSGLGGVVPMSAISKIKLVTGGSLVNRDYIPAEITETMDSLYNGALSDFPDGVFVIDFASHEDGGYLTNEECLNTYVLNGVAVNFEFVSGSEPGAKARVYVGVEALKMATS